MKHTTEYLYGIRPLWFMFLPYFLALKVKEKYATRQMKRLVFISRLTKLPYEAQRYLEEHYQDCEKARDYNRNLLKELWK